jgi:HPt (histidine-containing phosphotransfer) domain-containing protein
MISVPEEIYSTLLDDEDLLELVELFVEELPSRIAQIVEAKEAGNVTEIGRFAHQLKGAAGSYGFDVVTPFAARLERAARSAEPEEVIESALQELLEICGRLRAGVPAA